MNHSFKIGWVLAASALLAVGCNQMPAGGGGGVAVMDLAAVAKATGQDEAIRQEAEEARAELTAELQSLASSLEQQITAEREKIGIAPSEADQKRLQEMTMAAQQQINNAQMLAQNQASQIEGELVQEFRDKLTPLTEKIARAQGVSVVMASEAYMFWFDPAVDITDEVIAAWRAAPAEESTGNSADELADEMAEVQAELDEVEEELAEAEEEIEELQEEVEEVAGDLPVVPAE